MILSMMIFQICLLTKKEEEGIPDYIRREKCCQLAKLDDKKPIVEQHTDGRIEDVGIITLGEEDKKIGEANLVWKNFLTRM